jgi:hypothetical protein
MGNSILGISSQKNQGDLSKNKVADDPVSSPPFRLVRTRPSIVVCRSIVFMLHGQRPENWEQGAMIASWFSVQRG